MRSMVPKIHRALHLATASLCAAISVGNLHGQVAPAPATANTATGAPVNWTTEQDHRNMMEQLGIKRLRAGPSGRQGATNSANYDPAKANPFPNLPDPLIMKDGRKVTTPEMWWKERRPEKGDALWLDQEGSYMAAVAAGPVYRLLGARDLGVTEDYRTAQKPPANTGLLDGHLAWRQHDGGHEDWSNMKYFIAWADKFLEHSVKPK